MPASLKPPENESALIRAAQRGSMQAFNTLVLHYQNAVFTLAYRLMGESHGAADASQEAFIAAYRRLDSYRGGSFRAWLLKITANQCYDALRRDKRHPESPLDANPDDDGEPQIADSSIPLEQIVERRELRRALQDCINELAPDQRMVLVLSDVEGLDYQTIAEQTSAALGTVKSRLSRARASMRDCLRGAAELFPAQFRLPE